MEYSQFNDFNRFQNLDGIEAKIVEHLVNSTSKHASIIWKLLKYNDLNALSRPDLTIEEKKELVCFDNGYGDKKRVFFQPFVDDAWQEQCSSLYIYVEQIVPQDQCRATIGVTIETVVHSKIAAVRGDGDPYLNKDANPNDSDSKGNIVVAFKNRATVLLKSILAELNGLYIDGIGYLQFNQALNVQSKTEMPLFNNRSFYGHATMFAVKMGNVSGSSSIGF